MDLKVTTGSGNFLPSSSTLFLFLLPKHDPGICLSAGSVARRILTLEKLATVTAFFGVQPF